MILETLFSLALFITSGNLIDTKFGLHKYSEQDYKEIFYLKNNKIMFFMVFTIYQFTDSPKCL